MKLDVLRSRMLGLMEVLYSIQSLHALLLSRGREMKLEDFREFARDPVARHAGLLALTWNPRVKEADRVALESSMSTVLGRDWTIKELDGESQLRIASQRDSYVPVLFVQPMDRNEAVLGFDLASEQRRRLALEHARDTGDPFTTPPVRLVQEPEDQLGCLVVLPLYAGPVKTVAQRRAKLTGFASAAFRIGDMVDSVVLPDGAGEEDDRLEVAVFDKSPEANLIYRRSTPDWRDDAPDMAVEWLEFAGARWRVRVQAKDRSETSEEAAEPNASQSHSSRYRDIVENALVGIFQTTTDGRYLSANPAMARIYGYASPEELMQELSDIGTQLYVDKARREEFRQLVRQHDTISGFESQVRRRDGVIIWISEKARAVRDTTGRLLHYEGIVEDVTEIRYARASLERANEDLRARDEEKSHLLSQTNAALMVEIEERKRAEKASISANEAKSAFLSHMSHEIRTPLNAVIGYAQILQRDASLDTAQRQAVEALAAGSDHLLALVDRVLDLSKIEAGRMEVRPSAFDLQEMVGLMKSMFRNRCQQKRLDFVAHCDEPGGLVEGDEILLRQVLINLLSNAVKFTDLGMVSLTVRKVDDVAWNFEVADSGMGIEPDVQERIFEPYQQAAAGRLHGGTGLGLTIIKRQIELMGGKLELDSAPGRGSRFFFTLPLIADLLPDNDHRSALSQMTSVTLLPGQRVTALVVDDVAENRQLLERMLIMTGCDVLQACNGLEALELAEAHAPDIVFMDIWMPEMNGIEAAQLLLKRFRTGSMKIVAHSASAFDHEARRYLEAGFEDFFPKPFRFERLCACLVTLLPERFSTKQDMTANSPLAWHAAPVSLPAALSQRLRAAADTYNITGLKECLPDLAAVEREGAEASRHLAALIAAYDMEGIIAFLQSHTNAAKQVNAPANAAP